MFDFDAVNDFVRYDAATGYLYWRDRTVEKYLKHGMGEYVFPRMEEWSAANAGAPAFATHHKDGSMCGLFCGKRITAHKIVWLLHGKEWPDFRIYHVDGDKANNRIENLSRRKADKFIKARSENGYRPTDTVKIHDGGIWAFRDGRPYNLMDSRVIYEDDAKRMALKFDMRHD